MRYWTNVKERKLPGFIRHRDNDGQTNTRNARRGRAREELAARDGIIASGFQLELEKSKWSRDEGKLLRSTILLVKKLNSQICPTVTMWQNLKNNKQNK